MNDLFVNIPTEISLGQSKAILYHDFLKPPQSDLALQELIKNTPWKQDEINFMGKITPVPRLAAWYSKELKNYFYSGIEIFANPYTDLIAKLNTMAEVITGYEFNSVLVNLYRNGTDSVSWHADDEPALGETINIASLTLGVARDFQLKRKDGAGKMVAMKLTHGSLLSMQHPTQQNWLHQIPKRKNIKRQRVNLTFRKLL
jgi:alkylated DNA repair dioxygenase AlkB